MDGELGLAPPAPITQSENIHTVITASKYPALHICTPHDHSVYKAVSPASPNLLTQVYFSSGDLPPHNIKYLFASID